MNHLLENSGKTRMVLIDDDPVYRTIVTRCAQMAGIDLDVYESLLDLGAIGLLGRYDAAIVDYDLGNMNGIEIAEYLSSLFGDIPMVLVSEKARSPDERGWPNSIKKFMKKSEGYAAALNEAKKFADQRIRTSKPTMKIAS
jgi:CheY-like chemotaxis protein